MCTCLNSQKSPVWIANRLNLTVKEVQASLRTLVEQGFLEELEDSFVKKYTHLRFPTTTSIASMRNYHKTMIEKAVNVINTKTSEADFNRRFINTVSVAVNPKKLSKAQEHLTRAIYELVEILTEGDCSEIYQLNLQFFPISTQD